MSGAVRVTWARTMGRARNLYLTAFSVAGYLLAAAISFAYGLEQAEGTSFALGAIWAQSAAWALPVLAAFLGMDVWSDERKSGRIDFLLTTSVSEGQLVLGKWLGVWTWLGLSVILFGVFSIGALFVYAPMALAGVTGASFVPAVLILLLQGALWSAVVVMVSALARHPAVAALVSIVLLVALPRGAWALLQVYSPQGRTMFGEMPLDAQVVDVASGALAAGTILVYLIVTIGVLFIASNVVMAYRFVGRGARHLRWSTGVIVSLACVIMVLAVSLVTRFDWTLDVPVLGDAKFSPRTRTILAEAHGEVTVTCFLPRRDARWRAVGQFMRSMRREALSLGGVKLNLQYVDPRWDVAAASRLVQEGFAEETLVFMRGRRAVALPLKDGIGERNCASAILNLTMPPLHRMVYWTRGHGEIAFDDYSAWGMSDMARELAREGYQNLPIDLTAKKEIPSDCALIIVAGAKSDFSRAELGGLGAYLRQGGRMLVLLGASGSGGVAEILPSLGIRPVVQTLRSTKSLSGGDVVVSEFSDHAIVAPLKGAQVVFDRPIAFEPSSAAEGVSGVDRVEFSPLAKVANAAVAVLAERGAGTGEDLALRPMRIAAIGDATFVLNGQLAVRSNANRDFFLNCVAYLSGTDALVASGLDAGQFSTGMDRTTQRQFTLVFTLATAGSVFVVMMFVASIRRRHRA